MFVINYMDLFKGCQFLRLLLPQLFFTKNASFFTMKATAGSDLPSMISRALISGSNNSKPSGTWSSFLEHTLHQLVPRNSLTPSLVSRVISPHLTRHSSLALGFFSWASQQPNYSHTSLSYQSLLESLSLSRHFNPINLLLKQVKSQNISLQPSVHRTLITSFIKGKNAQNAFLVFNEFRSSITHIGAVTCNSLLAALASEGFVKDACRVFEEMCNRGVCFSSFGFGVFIWNICRRGEAGRVLGCIDAVKSNHCGSEINGSIVAVLIVQGLCHVGDAGEASLMLEELRLRNWKPDFMAYRVVAEALRLKGSVDDAEKVLKRKRKLGVAPRSNEYGEFIFELISEGKINEVKELGDIIVSGNFPIEDNVLNALIGSVSAVDLDSAFLFLRFLIEKGRLPNTLTVSNLCRNLSKHGKTDKLLEMFKVLSENNFFSDTERYNVMVSYMCKVGMIKDAYEVLQEMKRKRLGLDVCSYNLVIEACCRNDLIRPAKRLWDEMFANGCRGNLRTYNILVHKFAELGQMDEALRLFNLMSEKGVVADAFTYRSLLEGLCKAENLDAAFEVFNGSVEQDTELAHTILSSFILHLCKKGYFLAASELLHSLPDDIAPADSHAILLKCLAEAAEIPLAIEHIKRIKMGSPLMLPEISTHLLGSLSSSLEPQPILQLFEEIRDDFSTSNNDNELQQVNIDMALLHGNS